MVMAVVTGWGSVASLSPAASGRFVSAVKTAINAHRSDGPDTQSLPTLLSSAPLLLACDAASLDFWQASADELQEQRAPHRVSQHTVAPATACGQDWWPQQQLVGLVAPRVRSRGITEVMAVAQAEQQGQAAAGPAAGAAASGGGAAGADRW